MAQTLAAFLKYRAEHSYSYLLKQVDGVTTEEALSHIESGWPDHKWGIGQNGSIAGIVYHVAAWKQMTLPIFRPGGRPMTREEFDQEEAPLLEDWQGVQAWLKQVGMAWSAELAGLPEDTFDTTRLWEGHELSVASFVVEMYEHDIQHAAQIEYLRQHIRANSGA